MKRKTSFFVMIAILATVIIPAFAVMGGIKASALDLPFFNPNLPDGKINYAYGQEYTVETNAEELDEEFLNDAYQLVDGYIPYEETIYSSVRYSGVNEKITFTIFLDDKYKDIESINLCGVLNDGVDFGFAYEDVSIQVSADGITFFDYKYFASSKENWSVDGLENSYYNYIYKFNAPITASALRITVYSPAPKMSLNEIQVIGYTNSIYYADYCGDAFFEYYRDGTMVISGTGYISGYSFALMTQIKKVIIEEGVTEIGEGAFYSCLSLKTISLPSSLKRIENEAFSICMSLEEIKVDENNKYFTSLDGVLFDKSMSGLLAYPMGKKDTSYKIPQTVGGISVGAFSGTMYLENIEFSENLECINENAFLGCVSLKKVHFPKNVATYMAGAFSGCESLEEFTVDENCTNFSAKDGVLFNKAQDVLICYPAAKPEATYDIPETVVAIDSCAFEYCENIKEITLGGKVERFGEYVFHGCTFLESVVIGDAAIHIGEGMFANCSSLSSVVIGENVTTIESDAFWGCYSLGKIEIPQTVTSIGTDAFSADDGVTILCKAGSYSESYAVKNGINYEYIIDDSYFNDPKISTKNGFVYGLPSETTMADFAKIVNTEFKLTDKNGSELSSESYISTGTVLEIGEETFVFIIKGDTNGDGEVTATDYLQIKKLFLGGIELEGAYYLAADTDENGEINSTDYLQIKSHFLEIINIYA